jgi:hypothetical protein
MGLTINQDKTKFMEAISNRTKEKRIRTDKKDRTSK